MRDERQDLEDFFSLTPDMLCIAGFDGFFKRLSPSWERVLGHTCEELMALPYVSFVHPDDHQATTVEAERLTSGDAVSRFINRYRCKDGSYKLMEWSSRTDLDRQLIFGAARDITDRHRIESRLRHLVASSPVVLYTGAWEGDYAMTFVSDNVRALFGYTPEELSRPRFWADLVHPDDAPRVFAELESIPQKERATLEYRFRHKNGGYRWVRDDVKLARSGHGHPVEIVGSRQDITEGRQTAQIIEKQATALMELSTPLIPISDDVLVMPLIGMMDTMRAHQVLDTLLSGIGKSRARIAILDITGVGIVDTQVANMLITAARAAQLLGAKVVLTGIRPEVANTLVGLGAELSDIVTRGTLQSGIQYAMGSAGSDAARRDSF